jgi:hypothetical protein
MKPNDPILDPAGRPARLITMPIPGRPTRLAVVLYADGHGRIVDLAQCRPDDSERPPVQPRLL